MTTNEQPLNEVQRVMLHRLGECAPSSGMVNADFAFLIARQSGAESTQKHAAYIRRLLVDLEKRGLIVRADNERPILWRLKR